MTKVEIIVNKAIEEDIIEVLEAHGYGENFTFISPVFGRGHHGRRERSAVWPEENILFHIEVEEEVLHAFSEDLKRLKQAFPREGMRVYIHRNIERLV